MKRIFGIIALCLAVFAAVSCKPAASLTVSPDACGFSSDGGDQTVTVTANYNWTAKASSNWIKVQTASGTKDDTSLRFTVAKNNQPDGREATIAVTCEDVVQTIKITQDQKNTVVSVTGDEVSFPWEAQTVTIEMSANVDYVTEVGTTESWIKIVDTKGLTASSVTLALEENDSYSARTATLDFSYEGEILKQVYVTQTGKPQKMVVVHGNRQFSAPVIFGFGMSGSIDWGDGKLEKYGSTLTHTYTSDGPFEVVVDVIQASTASVSNFIGIEKVDLSAF